MLHSRNSVQLLSIVAALAVSLTLLGCDSSGSNGGDDGGGGGSGVAQDLELRVEGSAQDSITYTSNFFYSTEGSFNCKASGDEKKVLGKDSSFTAQIDPAKLLEDDTSCSNVDDKSSYVGVEVKVLKLGRDLTLTLLDGSGSGLDTTSTVNSNSFYTVETGEAAVQP